MYYSFGFIKKGEFELVEKAFIEEQHPEIYKKCHNAILKSFNTENIRKSTSYSLIWDYIYDQSGKNYDFKKFSENCIDIYENMDSELSRISKDITIIVRFVESEL